MAKISAILCAHNSRPDYLDETLASLRTQDIASESVEFILVDNGSEPPMEVSLIENFPYPARIVRETTLGLTPARVKGIHESKGDLLVFVDDDNVLIPNYLSLMLRYFEANEILGCAGGTIEPRFEKEPPEAWRGVTSCLALRTVKTVRITNVFEAAAMPYGAGMGIRRGVAQHYADSLKKEAWRSQLDRRGASLASAGDVDMACTACDLGLACGLFPDLSLIHLIPARRTEPEYLQRLALGISQSNFLLRRYRKLPGGTLPSIIKEAIFSILRGKDMKKKSLFLRGKFLAWRMSRQS